MSMCKKQMSFFCSANKNRKLKNLSKPEGFNHFMLKEILDLSQVLRTNFSFYSSNKTQSYEFRGMLKNSDRVQIFASNDMLCVAKFCKKYLESKIDGVVEVLKYEDKNEQKISKNKNDISIFFISCKDLKNNKKEVEKYIKMVSTKKVVFVSNEILKNYDADIVFPIFVEKENIDIFTKTYLSFCFVFMMVSFDKDEEKIKGLFESLDDFDIMPIVNFAKKLSTSKNFSIIGNNIFCSAFVLWYFKNLTTINVSIKSDIGKAKEEILKNVYSFLVKDEKSLSFFKGDSFCLNNLGIEYLSLITIGGEEKELEKSLIIKTNKELGDFSEILFVFYIQLITFYVAIFQGINPDLKS